MNEVGPLKTPEVPNHLVWAILSTLFCCLPLGIISIVLAAQVNGKLAAGDYGGAVEASRQAKKWAWLSFWIGLVVTILLAILVISAVLWAWTAQTNVQQAAAVRVQGPDGAVKVEPIEPAPNP